MTVKEPILPLAGVRVLEVAQALAGPFAAEIMSDLGADVIKVERPEGDDIRGWSGGDWEGASSAYHNMNRNKRSVVLDIGTDEGKAALLRLVAGADVLVQNLRPGALAKRGLDGPSLLKVNPRLVYCDLGAYGHLGPKRLDPGYEPAIQAFTGIMAATGEPDRPPVRAGVSLCDFGTGMWTAIGAISGLRERDRTGRGMVVNTSLLETGLVWMSHHNAAFQATGEPPERHPTGSARIAVSRVFETATGPLMISVVSDRLCAKFLRTIGLGELADDLRYATNEARMQNVDTLIPQIEAVLATRSKGAWIDLLDAEGLPCAPINALPEALEQEQVRALGIMQSPPGLDARFITLPISFDGVRPPIRKGAPRLGADNDLLSKDDPWPPRPA